MGRTLAIGDIHGSLAALETLLKILELRSDDVLILLGDYVNKGPDSKGVLERLIHLERTQTLHPLRGNHEIMMLHARDDEYRFRAWCLTGGDTTLASYGLKPSGGPKVLNAIPESHWSFIRRLHPYYETETHFFVHGNADPDLDLADQPDAVLYWMKFDYPPRHKSGKVMICGHTSQKSGLPVTSDHAICIDTRAWDNGWLSCLDVDSGTILQTNQESESRSLRLEDCP